MVGLCGPGSPESERRDLLRSINMSSITTSGLKSFTLASVLAIGTTVSFSAVAYPWGPSPPPYTSPVLRGDCTVTVGSIYDTPGRPWGAIGAAVVNCGHYHSLEVTVREVWAATPGGPTYFVGSPGNWESYLTWNLSAHTGRSCGIGTWQTWAYVWIDGFQWIVRGYISPVTQTGC